MTQSYDELAIGVLSFTADTTQPAPLPIVSAPLAATSQFQRRQSTAPTAAAAPAATAAAAKAKSSPRLTPCS